MSTNLPGRDACKLCGAPVVWVQTRRGQKVALDPQPHPEGNVVLDANAQAVELTPGREVAGSGHRYRHHLQHCPGVGHLKSLEREGGVS